MFKKISIFTIFLFPTLAFAQSFDVDQFFDYLLNILNVLSGLLSSAAIAFFFWSLIKFIRDSNQGKTDLKKSKDMLIWSGVALFMMVGIWSIVAYVQSSVGLTSSGSEQITVTPLLPGRQD